MKATEKVIFNLQKIDRAPDEILFTEIFGTIGKHLFSKYRGECDRRILNLWRVMDLENQQKLVKYLEGI